MALPLAIAILLLLFLMLAGIRLMSRQSHEELARLDGFLRAVAVGEAAHSRAVARLEAVAWDQRWFKGGTEVDSGIWRAGSYDYLVADGPGAFEADLLVRATDVGHSVTMLWRLRADPFTLSPYRLIRTLFFTHADPRTQLSMSGLAALRLEVAAALAARDANRGWAHSREREIVQASAAAAIPPILGLPPAAVAELVAPPEPGGPPTPQPDSPIAMPPPLRLPVFPKAPVGPPALAPPASIDALSKSRLALLAKRKNLIQAIESFNRKLGTDETAPPAERSEFVALDMRVKAELSRCEGLRGEGTYTGQDCSDAKLGQLRQCKVAIDRVHNEIRPSFAPIQNEMFVSLGELEQLEREIDESSRPPGPSQSQVDAFARREQAIGERVGDLKTQARKLQAQYESLMAGSGCSAY